MMSGVFQRFAGVGTALATPFCASGARVDYAALKKTIERQVEGGASFLVLLGTTGEAPTVSRAERREMISCAVNTAADRIAVVVGAGGNDTAAAAEMCAEARDFGADGVLVVTPYYNKPTQEGLFRHFERVASVGLPVIAYNVPGRTGVNMLPATVARIAEIPGMAGVKEASGNLAQIDEIVSLTRSHGNFCVLSGNDDQTFHVINAGGHGVVSVSSNVAPAETVSMVDLALAGRVAEARELHIRLAPLVRALFTETNPIPVKYALSQLGLCENCVRLPLVEASSSTRAIDEALEALGMVSPLAVGE